MSMLERLHALEPPQLGLTLVLPPENGRSARFQSRLDGHKHADRWKPPEGSPAAREAARMARTSGAPGIERSTYRPEDSDEPTPGQEERDMAQGMSRLGSGHLWRDR